MRIARFGSGFGALAALSTASACVQDGAGSPSPSANNHSEGLARTHWQIVEFVFNDDAQGVTRPAEPQNYTVTFNADGSAHFQLDCNRGTGRWEASNGGRGASGTLTFTALATTRAFCPEPSIGTRLAGDMESVRTFLRRDDMLYMDLLADAGTWAWRLEAGRPATD